MSGVEHYREAERLLRLVGDESGVYRRDPVSIAAAQVHATLALAAATALSGVITNPTVVKAMAEPNTEIRRAAFESLGWDQAIKSLDVTLVDECDDFANPGDWIIRGVAGEFYPCKPDIFAATYEEI